MKQQYYPDLEFDTTEIDIVQIWQNGDVIQVERDKLQELIEILSEQL